MAVGEPETRVWFPTLNRARRGKTTRGGSGRLQVHASNFSLTFSTSGLLLLEQLVLPPLPVCHVALLSIAILTLGGH